MLNYSVHALEDLSSYDLNRLPPEDARGLKEAMGFLHRAVKFELPENGSLFGDDFHKGYDVIDCSLLYLPFPIMALEYPFSYYTNTSDLNFHSPKRIALCLDYEANKGSFFGETARKYLPRVEETGGIILLVFCLMEGNWFLQPWGVVLPRFEPEGSNLSLYMYGKPSKTAQVGFMAIPILLNACRGLMIKLSPELAMKNALNDAGEEITSLIGLLAALSCSNVKLNTEPAPLKLNAKRAKNGKLPFYEYKIVTVDVNPKTAGGKAGEGTTISGRSAPREHLRRGHIRRLATGKNIWVQAAIIGSARKGYIEKSYKIGSK